MDKEKMIKVEVNNARIVASAAREYHMFIEETNLRNKFEKWRAKKLQEYFELVFLENQKKSSKKR